jgi:hypothetical protein
MPGFFKPNAEPFIIVMLLTKKCKIVATLAKSRKKRNFDSFGLLW